MWRLLCATLSLLICVKDSLSHLDEFGRPFLNPRIVGGKNTDAKVWPWMVSLNHDNGKHFCGGSLITNEWVLTAAHCVKGKDKSKLRAHLGKTKQEGKDPDAVIMEVKEIIIHGKYDEKTDDNDIALLQLSTTVPNKKHITTLSLADKNSVFVANTKSWITGWGDIGENKPLPPPGILQVTTVKVFENSKCEKRCGGITDNMICAGSKKGGKDTWKGDSGGPMVNKWCSGWVQSGITSWGRGCAKPKVPGVYTRVSRYQDWITSETGKTVKFVHFPKDPCPPATKG